MEEYRWVAARALVDRQAVSEARGQKAAKAAPVGQEEDDPVQRAQDLVQERAFQIPDLEAIADTVLKWQAEDDYVRVAKDYLLRGKFPKEVDYQHWLSTLSQQLELDDYGILYRRCPDSNRRVIYVLDCA